MGGHLRLATETHDSADEATVASGPAMIGVLLADDHALMRRSLQLVLERERDIEVLGEASDLAAAARLVRERTPTVLVLDTSMPDGSSLKAIRELHEQGPKTRVVVLSTDDSPYMAERALAAGASAYVLKELADVELASAIRTVSSGGEHVSARVRDRLEALSQVGPNGRLSPREEEVLRLIALGHTSVEIAGQLLISPRTVETHRAHIHEKLGCKTRAELVRYALRHGMLSA
ncbi:MAG TPA: response regulator transcription factor [Solirubrobacteraceae bacterium]|nr:response regulator transcription factor [Solirubrobacteraceae bacterium]